MNRRTRTWWEPAQQRTTGKLSICFRDVRLAFRRDDGRESLSESRMQQQSKHAAFRLFVLRETLRFARAQHKRPLQFARNPVRLPNTNVYGRLFFPVQTGGNASNICGIGVERSPYQNTSTLSCASRNGAA